jgi:eukaryotic-like serine/threonine-protein kinase
MADAHARRWRELEPHLDACLTASEAVRRSRVAELRARDPDLAARLERALAAREELAASRFLEGSLVPTWSSGHDVMLGRGLGEEVSAPLLDAAAAPEVMVSGEHPRSGSHGGLEGRLFGPYRVIRLLGRGGMGSVWLAERIDGLFERQVALKIMHHALLDTREQDRFARERQIVGALRHPHIAQLLDAGVSADGQPYLALELVEGTSITAHADAHRLPLRRRIELMLQVLSAVEYAHNSLVIHRDLKPSNILVTPAHEIRLLDFGIAKLMSDGIARETELTAAVGRALTPEFASPEQLLGQPLTTASDVYSLGVLLYALLSGEQPYRLAHRAPGALEDAILNVEPLRPSARAPTPEASELRGATPQKLTRALRGDLDTIVLKAIRKDHRARYPSAEAFRQDLERYLAGEPVLARPDSRAYRTGKFLRRHWLRVGVGALVSMALIGAAAVSVEQARAAKHHQLIAEREARRSQAVLEFLLDLFAKNSDQQSAPAVARELTARQLLEIGAREAPRRLESDPEVQAEILNQLADIYAQLKLGEQAGELRRAAIEALARGLGPEHERVAHAWLLLAMDVAYTNQRALARDALAKARAILDHRGDQASEARGMTWLASAQLNRHDSLAAMFHDAEQARRHFGEHPPESLWSGPFKALELEGLAHHLAGHYVQAEALQRRAILEVERATEHSTAWRINPTIRIAEAQLARVELDAAIATFEEALSLSLEINGETNGQTLQTRAKLGGALYMGGRREEGLSMLDATLAALESAPETDAAGAWSSLRQWRGVALFAEGRIEEADALWSAEVEERRKYYPSSMPLGRASIAHASAAIALGRYAAAEASLDEGCRLWRERSGGVAAAALSNDCWLGRAQLSLARRQPAEAVSWLEQVAPLPDAVALQVDGVQAQVLWAVARLEEGDAAAAQSSARAALAALEASGLRGRHRPLEANARLRLGQALHGAVAAREALPELESAVSSFAATGDARSPWLGEAKAALGRCLLDAAPTEEASRQRARALLDDAQQIALAHPGLGEHLADRLRARTRER